LRAAVVTEEKGVEVWDLVDPEPGPFECLVKIDACAICTGTDSNIISGNFPGLPERPFILGHESTGVIVELGSEVRSFSLGERVTRPAGILPGRRREGVGSNWGGFSELGLVVDTATARESGVEYTAMSDSSRRPLPGDVDPVSAALSVNQREILSVVSALDVGRDSRVVVLGSGYNGMLFSLHLKEAGAGRVLMTGSEGRRDLALGPFEADVFCDYKLEPTASEIAELLAGPPDLVIDAVGTRRSLSLAGEILGPSSSFGRYGLHEHDKIEELTEKIKASHRTLELRADEVSATDRWYELWTRGFYNRPGIFDGTMPLEEITLAFERLANRDALKIVVSLT
jgi:threonine dehydrogenase-like Zn-dependent dehydrogenase